MTDEFDLDDATGYPVPDDLDADAVEPLAGQAEANSMLRRLRHALRSRSTVVEAAAADIANTTAWRDRRVAGIDSTIAWAERSLEGWLRATNKVGGPKSVTLPAGAVRLRKPPARVVPPLTEPLPADEAWWTDYLAKHPGIESPVKVARSWARGNAAKIVTAGPATGKVDPDSGYAIHTAVDADGAALPGWFVLVAPVDGFSYTPAVAEVDLDAEVPDAAAG